MAGGPPVFSVVVATYNWSSALKVALQSIAAQTFEDFEVLVVGDACTDDSADAVAALQDHRFQWHNLPKNCGSQWGPNNFGIAKATGRYVAYLGHDDLWWPTHLQSALAAFERTQADIVAGATLIYGPPESGVRAVTGLFPNGAYRPRYFFPPSSMLHKRETAQRVGGWHGPDRALVAVDVDFLARCHAAGAAVAATEEFTVFKFSAAWRRNVYQQRDAREQQAFLDQMRAGGEAFRSAEIAGALKAAVLDKLHRVELQPQSQEGAGRSSAVNAAFKGSRPPLAPSAPEAAAGRRRRYAPADVYAGFEWHALEQHPRWGAFRWSGPSTRSVLLFPERLAQAVEVRVLLVASVSADVLAGAVFSVDDVPMHTWTEVGRDREKLVVGRVAPRLAQGEGGLLALRIDVPHTWRSIDLGSNEDRRWLGLAIGWVEFTDLR